VIRCAGAGGDGIVGPCSGEIFWPLREPAYWWGRSPHRRCSSGGKSCPTALSLDDLGIGAACIKHAKANSQEPPVPTSASLGVAVSVTLFHSISQWAIQAAHLRRSATSWGIGHSLTRPHKFEAEESTFVGIRWRHNTHTGGLTLYTIKWAGSEPTEQVGVPPPTL
jgi:hypothetical protein